MLSQKQSVLSEWFWCWLVFRYNTKDYCTQQAKPQLAANWLKSPPPLLFLVFGEILGLCHVTWCNFKEPYHWPSHLGPDRRAPPNDQRVKKSETGSIHFLQFPATLAQLAEKTPPPPAVKEGKFWDWIYPFHAISSNFGSAGRKAPLPSVAKRGKILRLDLSISCNFQQLWFSWQKSPPPCLFMRDLACITNVEYPWSPYYKSTLRFLLSEYLL